MVNLDTGAPHTAHTTNKVPFIIAGPKNAERALAFTNDEDRKEGEEEGALCDVAPTLLALLGLEQPEGAFRSLTLTNVQSLITCRAQKCPGGHFLLYNKQYCCAWMLDRNGCLDQEGVQVSWTAVDLLSPSRRCTSNSVQKDQPFVGLFRLLIGRRYS